MDELSSYKYGDHNLNPSHIYRLPEVKKILPAEGLTNRTPAATILIWVQRMGQYASDIRRARGALHVGRYGTFTPNRSAHRKVRPQ
jgi:hypothetical protein